MILQEHKESKADGTVGFPISYYYVDETKDYYVMNLHWHGDFELIRVLSGELNAVIAGVPYALHAGDIILVDCEALHRAQPIDCVYECIVCDLNMFQTQMASPLNYRISALIHREYMVKNALLVPGRAAYDIADRLFEMVGKPTYCYEFYVYGQTLCLLGELFLQESIVKNQNLANSSKPSQAIRKLLSWIGENFTNTITLENLARVSHLSEKYICKAFKDYTTKTPIEYVNEMRIDMACHALIYSDMSVTQIAYECGFNDCSYFCKVFKEKRNISPKKYRNLNRSEQGDEKISKP